MPVTTILCPLCARPTAVCHAAGDPPAGLPCARCAPQQHPRPAKRTRAKTLSTRTARARRVAGMERELDALRVACGPFLRFAARVVEHCPEVMFDQTFVTLTQIGGVPVLGVTVGDCRRAVALAGPATGAKEAA